MKSGPRRPGSGDRDHGEATLMQALERVHRDHRFMDCRNSWLFFVPWILSIRNSIASIVPNGLRTLRRIHILFSRSRSTRSSSFLDKSALAIYRAPLLLRQGVN